MKLDLYVITDPDLSRGRRHEEVIRMAIEGGANVIQLRDKKADTRTLVQVGTALRDICRKAGVLFIVNDRVDVAMAVEADGVHVGQEDMPASVARSLLGSDKIVGVSAGTLEEALRARQDGADYLGVGAIYATGTKPDAGPPTGLRLISEIRNAIDLPIVAIGGLNASNAPNVISAGADGVAVVSAVVGAEDIAEAARKVMEAVALAKRRGATA